MKTNPSHILPSIVGPEFENQLKADVPEEDYHADKTSVSSGGCRKALESGRSFYRGFVMSLEKEETPAMHMGTVAHMGIMQPERFKDIYQLMPEFIGKTKDGRDSTQSGEARAKKASWIASLPPGSQIVSQEELSTLNNMIEAIHEYRDGNGIQTIVELLKTSSVEMSGYFRDPATGLKCRFRPDMVAMGGQVMADIKAMRKVDRQYVSREIWNRQYHIQLEFYSRGLKAITGKAPKYFPLICVQNCEPFEVACYSLDLGAMDRAESSINRGLSSIKAWIERGDWPGIQQSGVEDIGLPAYTDYLMED